MGGKEGGSRLVTLISLPQWRAFKTNNSCNKDSYFDFDCDFSLKVQASTTIIYYRHYSESHQTFGVEPTGSFLPVRHQWGLPCRLSSKEAIYQCREHGFNLQVGKLPLEKETAMHSSVLAWEIPWTEEPGGPQSTGSQRVGHDRAHAYAVGIGRLFSRKVVASPFLATGTGNSHFLASFQPCTWLTSVNLMDKKDILFSPVFPLEFEHPTTYSLVIHVFCCVRVSVLFVHFYSGVLFPVNLWAHSVYWDSCFFCPYFSIGRCLLVR